MSQYGPPGDNPYGAPPAASDRDLPRGMAITALVLGVLSILTFWTLIGGILLGLVALVLGLIASSRAKKGRAGGRGLAIAGWVTGLVGLVVTVVAVVFFSVLFARILDGESFGELQDCLEQAEGQAAEDRCQQQFEDRVEDNLG